MGITKLESFTGEAEVFGRVVGVTYHSSDLHISFRGVSLAEAEQILEQASNKAIASVKVPGAKPSGNGFHPQTVQAAPAPSVPPAVEPPPKVEAPTVAKKEEAPSAQSQQGNNAEVLKGESALVTVLSAARNMRDVFDMLSKAGFKTPESMTAECLRLKAQVPVLGRIDNIEDRVKRAFETFAD